MSQVSRRNAVKITVAVPIVGSPACDVAVVLAILAIVVSAARVIVDVVEQSSDEGTVEVDVTEGYVRIKNESGEDQTLEILAELFHADGEFQNDALIMTPANGLITVKKGTKVEVPMPNMQSGREGEHYVRVSVAGLESYSDPFPMAMYS